MIATAYSDEATLSPGTMFFFVITSDRRWYGRTQSDMAQLDIDVPWTVITSKEAGTDAAAAMYLVLGRGLFWTNLTPFVRVIERR